MGMFSRTHFIACTGGESWLLTSRSAERLQEMRPPASAATPSACTASAARGRRRSRAAPPATRAMPSAARSACSGMYSSERRLAPVGFSMTRTKTTIGPNVASASRSRRFGTMSPRTAKAKTTIIRFPASNGSMTKSGKKCSDGSRCGFLKPSTVAM